ncbi:hypothetical protein RJ55_00651 [Drechmeria coniospora]|nr:hypothetical protein RJ55_00651 [Drechmeria coniospora]
MVVRERDLVQIVKNLYRTAFSTTLRLFTKDSFNDLRIRGIFIIVVIGERYPELEAAVQRHNSANAADQFSVETMILNEDETNNLRIYARALRELVDNADRNPAIEGPGGEYRNPATGRGASTDRKPTIGRPGAENGKPKTGGPGTDDADSGISEGEEETITDAGRDAAEQRHKIRPVRSRGLRPYNLWRTAPQNGEGSIGPDLLEYLRTAKNVDTIVVIGSASDQVAKFLASPAVQRSARRISFSGEKQPRIKDQMRLLVNNQRRVRVDGQWRLQVNDRMRPQLNDQMRLQVSNRMRMLFKDQARLRWENVME